MANGKAGPFTGLFFLGLERRGAAGAWAGMGKPLARCKMRTCWKKYLSSSCSPTPSPLATVCGRGTHGTGILLALGLMALGLKALGYCSEVFPEL